MAMARGEVALAKLPLIAKLAIGAGLMVLVGVAYFVVFYGDLSSSIKAAQNQEGQLRQQMSEARKGELNKVLPLTTEAPAFLSSLQSVANVAGVGLVAWAPLPELTEQFYARIPMKLELTGRFHQVAKFFYGVGQQERIINIENITIREPKLLGEDVIIKVEALATAFRMLQEPQAPKNVKRPPGKKG
jgi:type IV pilus assembly protein PilO